MTSRRTFQPFLRELYADDTALIADTEKKMFVKVVKEIEKQGLIINCKKKENIVVSKMNSPKYQLRIGDVEINM